MSRFSCPDTWHSVSSSNRHFPNPRELFSSLLLEAKVLEPRRALVPFVASDSSSDRWPVTVTGVLGGRRGVRVGVGPTHCKLCMRRIRSYAAVDLSSVVEVRTGRWLRPPPDGILLGRRRCVRDTALGAHRVPGMGVSGWPHACHRASTF